MKTVILAGLDNLVFSAADLLNPRQMKLIGFGTPIAEAWNIYEADGKTLKQELQDMPITPIAAAVEYDPDCIVLAASNEEDETALKFQLVRCDFRGEVFSLYTLFRDYSPKTAALRKLAWRLDELGVAGAAADLGAGRGDISWQLNALMPGRKLYLFDTFTGYDPRDIAREQELQLSDAKAGDYALTPYEQEHLGTRLLGRMPYPDQVQLCPGWFPDTALPLEDVQYALVHMDAGLYRPTFAGLQYFFPRMSRGGVIVLCGYENGKSESVRRAVADLEAQYGAFLITPLCDLDGTVLITRP